MIKPTMLWDGDCGFCRRSIEKWSRVTGDAVLYEPYQKVLQQYPQISETEVRKAVQLVLPDGKVLAGAHAVFKALALGGKTGWLWAYEHVPLFAPLAGFFYGLVAHHRTFFSKIL